VSRKSLKKFRTKPKPVAHIYTFAVVWVLIIVFTNVSADVIGLTILTVLSLVASIIVYLLVREKPDLELEELLKSDFMKSGKSEALEVFDSLEKLEQVRKTSYLIENKKVFKKSSEIIKVSKEILKRVMKKPELIPQNRSFFDNHLPTTNKLVDDYIEMENQSTKGENIHSSMKKVEQALATLEDTVKKQLDSLFSDSTMDLGADASDNLLNNGNSINDNFITNNGLHSEEQPMNTFVEKENEQE